MRATLSTALATAFVALTVSTASAEPCPDPIKVGWEHWPPFNISDGESVKGIDPDILRAVAEEAGCEVNFQEVPWKRLLRGIETGKMDLAMAANKTPERSKYAVFSDNYLPYQATLWVSSDDETTYKSLEDFLKKGNRLGAESGATFGEKADRILNMDDYKDQIKFNNSSKLNIRMLASGRLDGLLENGITAGYMAKEEGLRDKIRKTEVVPQNAHIRYMLSKKTTSEETIDALNQAIAHLKNDGTIDEIVLKYTK